MTGRTSKSGYKYVTSFVDNRGKTRWRFYKRGAKSCYLPDPKDPDFLTAYTEALNAVVKARTRPTESFDAAIDRYYASPKFKALKGSHQTETRRKISHLGAMLGEYSIQTLDRPSLVKILNQIDSPSKRNRFLGYFKSILQESVEQGIIAVNVAASIPRLKTNPTGYLTWSRDDIAKFRSFYDEGSTERIALYLLYYTGQRVSDVVWLGRDKIENKRLVIKQEKTGNVVDIPIHPKLADVLPDGDGPWLVTGYGKPFASVKAFSAWFAKRTRRAGIEGKSGHGLRKALATHLAESGANAMEIAAVTGHRTLSEVTRYTRAANRADLADTALKRLD